MYKKILVATDGSKLSLKAAEKGMELASKFNAAVNFVYVIDQRAFFFPHEIQVLAPENPYFTILEDLRKNAQAILDQLGKDAGKKGIKYELVVREGAVVDEINGAVEEKNIDLLILGAHGKTGESRGFLGSTTQAIVASAKCSFFVVRS